MTEHLDALAARVTSALEGADLEAIGVLLAPDATWGGPDPSEDDCRNRDEVLSWWRRARNAGARAHVTEVVTGEGKLLVGLSVTGREEGGVRVQRWQVLTVIDGLVTDVRGFDDRDAAAARAGVTSA